MEGQAKRQRVNLAGDYATSGGPQFIASNINSGGGSISVYGPSQDLTNCLRDLGATDPRSDRQRIANSKDELLDDSCSWVLEDDSFRNWWEYDTTHLLWIHGDPGKGKTMMMLSLESEISRRISVATTDKRAAVSYFFCQSTDPRLNHATAILKGLIFCLVVQDKQVLLPVLQEKLNETGDLETCPNLFYTLFRILMDLSTASKFSKVCFMIDALDECNQELQPLLKEIETSQYYFPKVKWLVTSRNEVFIKDNLTSPDRPCLSLELNSRHVSRAVDSFINAKVADLKRKKCYTQDITSKVKQYLSEKADGTFLWVALVFQELKAVRKVDTEERLTRFPAGLEPLYERILQQLSNQNIGDHLQRHRQVLRLITLALRPLHLEEVVDLGDLLPGRASDLQDAKDLIDECGSFLTIREESIYFIHQSAVDFFKTGKGSKIFSENETLTHISLAYRCMHLMKSTLRQNICGLASPGSSPLDKSQSSEKVLPKAIQYSAQYWLGHLLPRQAYQRRESKSSLIDWNKVYMFLEEHFLHWLEVMSLMGTISEGIIGISFLKSHISATEHLKLCNFIHDARRFILHNRTGIEQAPLQIYCSALFFAPEESIVRKIFQKSIPCWISKISRTRSNWSTTLQTLEGHSDTVNSVAFSPDSKLVASGSYDTTIRLWEAATGELQQILEGHSDSVNSVAFSPNSKLVASGSDDKTIRLWEAVTGKLQQTLEGHSDWVNSVAFSPNSKLVASGSDDKTIRLWDTATGELQQTLEGHSGKVISVAFSPNSKLVASGSWDKTIRLWDTVTGKLQQTLEGHSDSVNSVAFSPNSKLVASGSWDQTIQLLDTTISELQQTLEGYSNSVKLIAFSPDSSNKTIRLWDTTIHELQQILDSHSDSIELIAFSPDNRIVALGSGNKTIWLWDTATGKLQQILKGYSNSINSVAFSLDSRIVALRSWDKTIQLWNTATCELQQTLEGHSSLFNSKAFSPDSRIIALGSWSKTIQLRNTATGKLQQTVESYFSRTSSAFDLYFISNNWIAERIGKETLNILWLPPDYRPRIISVYKEIILIELLSGGIFFFRLEHGNRIL